MGRATLLRRTAAVSATLTSLVTIVAVTAIGPAGSVGAATTSVPLLAGAVLEVQVAGRAGVPGDATAATLNVTVADPADDGYLTVYPCGRPVPTASNLNYRRGEVAVPNAVMARIGANGKVCLTSSATTSVVVDIAGYVPTGSPITPLAAPRRLVDTREGIGAPVGRSGPGALTVQVAGREGIPDGVRAAVLNVTVVAPDGPGFATVYPCHQARPVASNINFVAGDVRPNLVVAGLDPQGRTCIFTMTSAHLVVDAIGYLDSGIGFQPVDNPERVLDTRSGFGAPTGVVGAGTSVAVQIVGRAGVLTGATSVVLNVTATGSTAAGFVTAYPCGTRPTASNLNHAPGQTTANLVVGRLDASGRICLFSSAGTHLVADVAGWFYGTTAHRVLDEPQRLYDSREVSTDPGPSDPGPTVPSVPVIDTTAPCDLLVYPVADGEIVVRDLKTGLERTMTGSFAPAERPVVSRDCSGVLIAGSQVGLPPGTTAFGVWFHGFDGTSRHLGNAVGTTAGGPTIIDEAPDGRVFATVHGGTWEITTSTQLYTPSSFHRPVGAARDGSVGVLTSALLFDFTVHVYSMTTGALVRTTVLPTHGYDPKLSPDGTRLAVGANPAGSPFPPLLTTPGVRLLDGTLVASYPGGEVAEPMQMNWMSDTEVIVCVPDQSPVIWTIGGGTVSTGAPARTGCPSGG